METTLNLQLVELYTENKLQNSSLKKHKKKYFSVLSNFPIVIWIFHYSIPRFFAVCVLKYLYGHVDAK